MEIPSPPSAIRNWRQATLAGRDGRLLVNPDDHDQYYEYVKDLYQRVPYGGEWGLYFRGWQIRADPRIGPGGCEIVNNVDDGA